MTKRITTEAKSAAVRSQLSREQLLPSNIAFVFCATAPPMLIDIGIDKTHCMVIALCLSLIVPAAVVRFFCKGSIRATIEVCVASTIGCTVLCALILSISEGTLAQILMQRFHVPLTAMIVLVCWAPMVILDFLFHALWDALGVGRITSDFEPLAIPAETEQPSHALETESE